MAGAGPYSELGQLLQRAKEKKAKQKKKTTLRDPRNNAQKTINEIGYITENGLDREDWPKYRDDRDSFRNDVNKFVTRNQLNSLKNKNRR